MCITDVDVSKILVLAFTRKVANEMKERIAGLSGISKSVVNTIEIIRDMIMKVKPVHGFSKISTSCFRT